ncbi:MAG: PLP-dependent aminotransferase family protein [Oscillospiraceae bacterium]
MEYSFARKMSGVQPSAIREIMKSSSNKEMIQLSLGNPSPESFPMREIEGFIKEIMAENPVEALQYGVTEGYAPLREDFRVLARDRYGSMGDGDDLIVTAGAQQAIDIAAKLFLNDGDTVIAEGPSFVGALNAFKANGATIQQVELLRDGMDLDLLEQTIKNAKNPKIIYTIPTFNNPTGLTSSLETRRCILFLARKYDLIVVEDNPYGDLRYARLPIPTIKSMDTDGRVIYCGSMSKILAPGLRVGFMVANSGIIAKAAIIKQTNDVHTPVLNQMICHKFLNCCDLDAHVKMIREMYKQKSRIMLAALEKFSCTTLDWTTPDGGLFIWCTLKDGRDSVEFCKNAMTKKVAAVPGNTFYGDSCKQQSTFRLNYSGPDGESIVKGVKILCNIAKKEENDD